MKKKVYIHLLLISLVIGIVCSGCGIQYPGQVTNPSVKLTSGGSPGFDNRIHLIEAPRIEYDADGGYQFVVFGDTRSASDDSKKEDKAFHVVRNRTHEMVKDDLEQRGFSFALCTGDLIWRGSAIQYWNEVRNQFPASVRSNSAPKIYPVPGNHEFWQQEGESDDQANYFDTFPYLSRNGVAFHNYAFLVGSSLFVNLCSGSYGTDSSKFKQDDQTWNCEVIESFDKVMESFRLLYREITKDRKLNAMFFTWHKPSYSTFKHPPLDFDNDPVQILKGLNNDNKELKIFVFNGHNHVTELFKPDPSLIVLVAGGGGAPQKKGVAANDHGKPMEELFWKAAGSQRYRRVNYFHVKVGPKGKNITIEERVVCADDAHTALDYSKGVVIDNQGNVSFQGSRSCDCDFDNYVDLIE